MSFPKYQIFSVTKNVLNKTYMHRIYIKNVLNETYMHRIVLKKMY